MKFLKKNKHLLIVLALFIALAAIAAGCTGKASGAENKGNDDYVVNISGADEMPHGTDFGSTDSPSSHAGTNRNACTDGSADADACTDSGTHTDPGTYAGS